MLKTEYECRVDGNPYYSLRAFARDIGVNVSRLPPIFRGEQGLSMSMAKKICQNVSWPHERKELFCNLVGAGSSRSFSQCKSYSEKVEQCRRLEIEPISSEALQLFSDWSFAAYLQLTRLGSFKRSQRWAAKRLGLSQEKVATIVSTLIDLGMVSPETLRAVKNRYSSSDGIPSEAIRALTKNVMQKAICAVDQQNVEERHISTLTVALPDDLLPEIFEKISKFRRELNDFIAEKSEGKTMNQVYGFQSSFFRISN